MAARKWTPEQRKNQSVLIHKWKPWQNSTGPMTTAGKKISSKNAVNYSLRELLRESTRVNKELLFFIRGSGIAPIVNSELTDKLFENLDSAMNVRMNQIEESSVNSKNNRTPSGLKEIA